MFQKNVAPISLWEVLTLCGALPSETTWILTNSHKNNKMTFLCGRLGGCGIIASERFFCQNSFAIRFFCQKGTKKPIIISLPDLRPRLKLPILEISEKGVGRGHETVSQKTTCPLALIIRSNNATQYKLRSEWGYCSSFEDLLLWEYIRLSAVSLSPRMKERSKEPRIPHFLFFEEELCFVFKEGICRLWKKQLTVSELVGYTPQVNGFQT